jgi:hypothetical protein
MQLDPMVYVPVNASGLLAAPTLDVVTFAVTLPCPSNCSNPAPSDAPLTEFVLSEKPVPLKVYEPLNVAVEQPVG